MAPEARRNVAVLTFLAAAAMGLAAWAVLRAADDAPKTPPAAPAPAAPAAPEAKEPGDYAVPAPPFSEGIYPCTDCHDANLPTNPRRRTLKMAHLDIQLHHDEEHRWCLDCHNAENRDVLRSASGAPIPFAESYRLCGQCHGDKLRDWKEGVHGKRSGEWNGKKQYLLCVNCHNPHSPRYKPIEPMPPPVRPENLR